MVRRLLDRGQVIPQGNSDMGRSIGLAQHTGRFSSRLASCLRLPPWQSSAGQITVFTSLRWQHAYGVTIFIPCSQYVPCHCVCVATLTQPQITTQLIHYCTCSFILISFRIPLSCRSLWGPFYFLEQLLDIQYSSIFA